MKLNSKAKSIAARKAVWELGQMLFGNSTAVINSNQLLSDEQQTLARDSEIGVNFVIFTSTLI